VTNVCSQYSLKWKLMKTHKKASRMKKHSVLRHREQKVLDFNIMFHYKRMIMWNPPLKFRKYKDTTSPEKQEKVKDQEEIKGKQIQRCSIQENNEWDEQPHQRLWIRNYLCSSKKGRHQGKMPNPPCVIFDFHLWPQITPSVLKLET